MRLELEWWDIRILSRVFSLKYIECSIWLSDINKQIIQSFLKLISQCFWCYYEIIPDPEFNPKISKYLTLYFENRTSQSIIII